MALTQTRMPETHGHVPAVVRSLPVGAIARALTDDREFGIERRGWRARLALQIGEAGYLVVIDPVGGIEVVSGIDKLAHWDALFRGTTDDWAALLSEVPPPFYQDFFSAFFRHGFTMAGNLELVFAFYPAVRRMLEILRAEYVAAAATQDGAR